MEKNCFLNTDENAKQTVLSIIASHEADGSTCSEEEKEALILYAQGKIAEREYLELSGVPKEYHDQLLKGIEDRKINK